MVEGLNGQVKFDSDPIVYAKELYDKVLKGGSILEYNTEDMIQHVLNTSVLIITKDCRQTHLQDIYDKQTLLVKCRGILKLVKPHLEAQYSRLGKNIFDSSAQLLIDKYYVISIRNIRNWLDEEF